MNINQKRSICCLFAAVSVIILVAFDQFTKSLAITHLKDKLPFVLIKDVFQLEYLENRGAAFGLFQNQRIFFYISVITITGVVIWFFLHVPLERHFLPLQICSVFILAGAFGNFADRVRLGYVVDFLYFNLIDFPVFNVADIYVTVSTVLIAILIFFYYKEEDFERIFHRRT